MNEQYSASELQQIFSNVCHELQSPLLAILGNVELLKGTIKAAKENATESQCDHLVKLLTETDEYIHNILLFTNHEITVTGKILSISKLDAGKVVLRHKLFSPHDTINDIVGVFKASLNVNQKIIIKLPEEELWVEGDETQLKQIIINLLNNAIKFTPQGTITISLTCKTDVEENLDLFFTIQDTGIGMTESELKKLFQRHSQANKYITQKFGGSGLGLSICKRLVELMGGTISVSSEKGVGTSFSFSVRCLQASTSTKVRLKPAKKVKSTSPIPRRVISTVSNIDETPLNTSDKRIFSDGDCGDLINKLDWSQNSLGSIDSWSSSLASSVNLCLVSLFPMSIWWGPEHTLLYNDPYRTILGHKHPDAMGARGLKVWEEEASVNEPILKSIMAGGDAVLFEDMLFHVTRDAGFIEECYFDIAYSAMFDDGGNINGVLNVATETTESVVHTRRMSLLAELSKASELNTIELVCQLIAEVLSKYSNDTPFSMLYLLDDSQNLVLRSCTGLLRDSHVSPSIITPAQRSTMPWSLKRVMDNQDVAVLDLPLEWELPGGIWPEPSQKAIVMPLKLRATSHKLFGAFICGISPRRCFDDGYYNFINLVKVQIGAALDTAYRAEQLADLDKAKTAFFTNISHEFRTPLALMLGPLADSLDEKSNGPLSQEQRDRQLLIQRNARRLLKLVNNLLEFSRLEAGRVDASYAPTDLTKLTREICNTFSSLMEKADIDFTLEIQELDRHIYVDKEMWEKIILNLLSNAFKFTFQGQISVTLESIGDNVHLSVRDTGGGIPEKELPRVFERFHRVENAHGRSFEGSGIGLAMIQEFVKLHKGTISVKSTLNKGTCFTVTIPHGYAHLPADKVTMTIDDAVNIDENILLSVDVPTNQIISTEDSKVLVEPVKLYVGESKHWQAPVDINNTSPRADTTRVLLVDDNADMRSYIGNILKRVWKVELAVDGLQALESALRDPPDLILTDVMMPNIDGLELIKRLRNDERTKGVPIILLSARAGDNAKVEGLDTGADDYLIKTAFSEKELLARVRNHLELGRLRKNLEREVAARTEELIQLNTALYEFIDMICHEVRNPLHGIIGNCELLKEAIKMLVEDVKSKTLSIESITTQGADLKKYLSNIEECVHHQTTMLDEVILLTKIDAKKIEFVNIVCEPAKFLSSVVHNFKSKITSKGIKILLNPVKEGSRVMTDPRCVNQILNGLLANIIENSAVGSEIAVSQLLMADNNQFKLQSNLVCTSVDIDEKTFSSLINTFSQINIGVGQNYTKSRFSLAISNKLVGLMGGDKITITKEGTGETGFTFTVICQKADELFSELDLTSEPRLINPPYIPTNRALIVEDNNINQTLCKALLKKLGFESEIANNGQEAVEKFKPGYFDFILMDVAMPIMDGIQATSEIRRIEAEMKVGRPVIIVGLSAYSQEEKISKASEAGMNDYISKPATFNKIANIIRQWTKPNPLRKTKSELLLQNSIVPNSEAITLSKSKQ